MRREISKVLLLGPQRFEPTLASAVRSLGIDSAIATVTAGWQERESEDDELREHVGGRAINLRLHERGEEVFAEDPAFAEAHRERQEQLRELQDLYRLRLDHAAAAVRALAERETAPGLPASHGPMAGARVARQIAAGPDTLAPEISDAIETVRRLDRRHLERLRAVHAAFDSSWRPHERPAIARHRRELDAVLREARALAIAGGHVAVLLNRVRMFGIMEMVRHHPVLAWSAGTMILAEQVVIYNDAPPHGAGNAEVLGAGLGIFPGVVPLPHASARLDLRDRARVSFFARRFEPLVCVAMDRGARLDCDGSGCTPAPGTMRLTSGGTLSPMVRA